MQAMTATARAAKSSKYGTEDRAGTGLDKTDYTGLMEIGFGNIAEPDPSDRAKSGFQNSENPIRYTAFDNIVETGFAEFNKPAWNITVWERSF